MKPINNGAEFLNLVFKDMKDSIRSESTVPAQRITEYLDRLERIHGKALTDENKRSLLKSFYYDKYIIKELPESYIKFRKGYFYDLGLTEKKDLTEEDKALVLGCIKNEQKEALDSWLDYLCSEENAHPTWFKYYVFQGVTKVGAFYPMLRDFSKRSSSTTDPFIPVRPDVIDNMYALVSKYLADEPLTEKEQEITSSGLNFRNLYSKLYTCQLADYGTENNEYTEHETEHIGPAISDSQGGPKYADDSYLDDIPQEDADDTFLPQLKEPVVATQKK